MSKKLGVGLAVFILFFVALVLVTR